MKSFWRVFIFSLALVSFLEAAHASSVSELRHCYLDGPISSFRVIKIIKEILAHRDQTSDAIAVEDDDADDDATSSRRKRKHHSESDTTVRISGDFKLGKDESTNNDVVIIGGTAEIEGNINGDLIMVGSKGTFSGHANGDMILVGTTLRVKPGATANGDLVSIGSDTPGSDNLKINGDRTNLSTFSPITPFFSEMISNLFLLRPMSPSSTIGWVLAIVALVLYLALAMAFPKPLTQLNVLLLQRLAPSFLIGLALVIGGAILAAVLAITVVGVLAIPFLILGLILLGFFGRIVISYTIGKLLLPRLAGRNDALPIWVIVGNVALWILFCIPIIGFIAYGISALLGMGVVAIYIAERYKTNTPKQLGPAAVVIPPIVPPPEVIPPEAIPPLASAPKPDYSLVATSYVVNQASFLPRLIANLIDLVVVYALLHSTHQTRVLIPIWILYRFGMYAWRSATLGEIAMNLRVQKATGASLNGDYSTSLIRALASLISLLPLGFGFIWILFNKEMQAWHDRISRTYVVRVNSL